MYTPLEETYRKQDPIKIVRRWEVSPVAYGIDSRERSVNPHYHPAICQKEDGTYCDPAGRTIPKSQIPKYILEDGAPPDAVSMGSILGKTMSLADAMRDTGMIAEDGSIRPTPVADPTPKPKRGRPRKRS